MPAFGCPDCGAPIDGTPERCPSCGVTVGNRTDAVDPAASVGTASDLSAPARGPTQEVDTHNTRAQDRLQAALGSGYVVGRLLGRGGFAEVFSARELALDRNVAVKVIRSDLAITDELRMRFQREARAVAGVRHPNVIEIYTVGEAEGIAFFVMPLIEGETLGQRLRSRGRLPVEEAKRILVETARGVEAAHRAGIVHRDLKPENLLLEGDEGRVVITDFGIAKAAMESRDASLTGPGAFVGTPTYMSPEQASGDDAGSASDLYSLGVVAYEMLAGRPPFQGSGQALLASHITEEPPPLRTLRPDCPEGLARTVARCLEKSPGRRWASALELAEAVAGSEAVPVELGPPTTRKSEDRNRKNGEGMEETVPEAQDLRRALAWGVGGSAAALAAEWGLTGQIVVSPALALAAVVWIGTRYGRLQVAGYDWRLLLGADPHEVAGPVSSSLRSREDTLLEGSAYDELVREGRGDRNRITRLVRDVPRAVRERHSGLVSLADRLQAGLTQGARRLAVLEARMDEVEGESHGSTRSELGRAEEARVQRTLAELKAARVQARDETYAAVEALKELRLAVERLASGADGADEAVEQARARGRRALAAGAQEDAREEAETGSPR